LGSRRPDGGRGPSPEPFANAQRVRGTSAIGQPGLGQGGDGLVGDPPAAGGRSRVGQHYRPAAGPGPARWPGPGPAHTGSRRPARPSRSSQPGTHHAPPRPRRWLPARPRPPVTPPALSAPPTCAPLWIRGTNSMLASIAPGPASSGVPTGTNALRHGGHDPATEAGPFTRTGRWALAIRQGLGGLTPASTAFTRSIPTSVSAGLAASIRSCRKRTPQRPALKRHWLSACCRATASASATPPGWEAAEPGQPSAHATYG
jgi:hypothetical protein